VIACRIEGNETGVDIHDFRDYLFVGNRFEKNVSGLYGLVVAGGDITYPPLTMIQNQFSSYAAGNALVTTGLVGRTLSIGQNANQYDELTGNGGYYLGLGKLYVGNPESPTAPRVEAVGSNTNMDLDLRAKGTGAVTATTYFFAPRLALVDAVTAPTTIAGAAQLYVDSADGDLKVKFGDGTIKTIVTDT
jgi:hypothetical protein